MQLTIIFFYFNIFISNSITLCDKIVSHVKTYKTIDKK